ncbi:unnamed protein product [Dovyalis caffra]|uniref:RNase H type-1 domain-containing protein n=1 Tax=Dovyalis caffra TaxID=77055 RepID=A0AAV1QYG9_9ROSI|nr:unnamed protein product [Dovyalis caffra]
MLPCETLIKVINMQLRESGARLLSSLQELCPTLSVGLKTDFREGLDRVSSILVAEALACHEAIREAKRRGLKYCIIETDAKLVVDTLKTNSVNVPKEIQAILRAIKLELHRDSSVNFVYALGVQIGLQTGYQRQLDHQMYLWNG